VDGEVLHLIVPKEIMELEFIKNTEKTRKKKTIQG
jgi:hypothetical protein